MFRYSKRYGLTQSTRKTRSRAEDSRDRCRPYSLEGWPSHAAQGVDVALDHIDRVGEIDKRAFFSTTLDIEDSPIT
jgi:hypothetical protein